MLVALLKQAEKKLIAVVFVAHLPLHWLTLPDALHPSACGLRAAILGLASKTLPEFDQLQSFTGIVMRVVKAVPSSPMPCVAISRWDFWAKHSQILLHSVSSRQAVP